MKKPVESEYPQNRYFSYYIEQVENEDVIIALSEQMVLVENLVKKLKDEQENYRYAEGKWSVKEILGHLVDTERIFAYRSLCIARGEKQSLPGFDENEYAYAANFAEQSMEGLFEQYRYTRLASLALFKSYTEEIASRKGMANGSEVSARGLVWMIAGHERHHLTILANKYGIS
jgi:uncharacterized damage-inducible protein DinB